MGIRQLLLLGAVLVFLAGCATVERSTGTAAGPGVTLTLGGDVLLDHWPIRKIYQKIADPKDPDVVLDYPFQKLKPLLKGIVFCNAEGPLTDRGPQKFSDKDEKSYFSVPREFGKGLARAGFTVVGLANNHIRDCGPQGVLQSIQTIREDGMEPVGAGADDESARRPVFVERNGLKVGFLSYDLVPPKSVWAKAKHPGAAHAELPGILSDVKAARAQCDLLVVNFHWGVEFRHQGLVKRPSAERVKIAHALIDAGVNLVVGEHSHSIERMERYKDGLIFYGMGNFVFGAATREGHPESMVLQVDLSRQGVLDYRVYPILISPKKTHYQPFPMEGEEREKFLKMFAAL
ncbi:MAG TPA: CapA family protein [bacterium]|nr:CapA family protein [bacterium]